MSTKQIKRIGDADKPEAVTGGVINLLLFFNAESYTFQHPQNSASVSHRTQLVNGVKNRQTLKYLSGTILIHPITICFLFVELNRELVVSFPYQRNHR